jgi:FtsP/CotA-like multicopper oxidase with cupredoxin domain
MAIFSPAVLCASALLLANQLCVQAANVTFEIRATWATGSPDGNSRQMIMVNDQFPGPQLTVNQGDQVQVWALPINLLIPSN